MYGLHMPSQRVPLNPCQRCSQGIVARLGGGGSQSGGQEVHVRLFMLSDLDETLASEVGKAGCNEVGFGELVERSGVEGVFEMFQCQRVLKNVRV